VLIFRKFSIDDCFHCKHIEKTWEELKDKFDQRNILFSSIKVDDKSPEVDKYMLFIFPCVIAEVEGKVVNRIEGVIPPIKLKQFVEEEIRKYESN
jgi:thioredoxin